MTTAAEALAIRVPRPRYEPETRFSTGSGNIQLTPHFDLLLSKYNFYMGSPQNSPFRGEKNREVAEQKAGTPLRVVYTAGLGSSPPLACTCPATFY